MTKITRKTAPAFGGGTVEAFAVEQGEGSFFIACPSSVEKGKLSIRVRSQGDIWLRLDREESLMVMRVIAMALEEMEDQ